MFQESIGIDIRHSEVILAHLKKGVRGVKLAAHSVYSMETGQSEPEKLEAVKSFLTEFKKENHIGTNDIVVGIPGELSILREIEYPLAVKENLRSTLGFEIDRYVPLSADDICFDYQVIEEDRGHNRLKVLLAIVKKTDCAPYLAFCRQWPGGVFGLEVSAAAHANCHAFLSGSKTTPLSERAREIIRKNGNAPGDTEVFRPSSLNRVGIPSPDVIPAFGLALELLETVPLRFNLLPPALQKKPSRMGYYTLIGLSLLALLAGAAWGGGYLFQRHLRLKAVDDEIRRLAAEAATVRTMEDQISAIEAKLDTLKRISDRKPTGLEILKELTRVIPKTAWVTDFSLTEKGILINGFAQSASELVSLLEASPMFEDVAFLSAIVKDRKLESERFSIGFKAVTSKKTGTAGGTAD